MVNHEPERIAQMSDTGVMFMQEAVMMVGVLALIGWIMFLLYKRYQVRTQENARKLEVFGKLVDKFGDSKDFVSFVQSNEGRSLLKDSGVNGVNPKQVALRMFVVGALLFAVGYGFLSGTSAYDNSTDPNFINKVAELRYWGKMAFGLAVGFVGAGILTSLLGGDSKKGNRSEGVKESEQ
jgi:hypothetical protein